MPERMTQPTHTQIHADLAAQMRRLGQAVRQAGALDLNVDPIVIGPGTSVTDGVDVIAIGDGIVLAPILGNTVIEDVIAMGDGAAAEIRDDGLVFGDGALLTYPTKPNDTLYTSSDSLGTVPWSGASANANDMIAIGDGAACAGFIDLVAIGDGATAMGMAQMLAMVDSNAGIWLNSGTGRQRFRRVVPDQGCIALVNSQANGLFCVAIGSAYAGRKRPYTGDPMNYKPQSRLLAFGYNAQAGLPHVALDVAGVDDATAFGPNTSATHNRSSVFGEGATSTAADQITLGTAADTIYIPGNLVVDGASTVGGGATHAVSVADSGGSVVADAAVVEFTGTAVTSVTDDGSGHVTVTIDHGSGGGSAPAIVTASDGDTLADATITLANPAGGLLHLTLPNPTSDARITVKNTGISGSGIVQIAQFGSELIDGVSGFMHLNDGDSTTLISDHTNWWSI